VRYEARGRAAARNGSDSMPQKGLNIGRYNA
jgi:hypothetical protein